MCARTAKAKRVFEEGVPLDSSVLWSWIRHYYTKGGVKVWSDGDVPFHITNTPVLAQEWADSILVFLRDFARFNTLTPERPIEVFEIGPGTGRHAFFLLRRLRELQSVTRAFCGQPLTFRLHLAELGQSGLESLASHPNLKDALISGDLMLHQFDIDTDVEPKLFKPEHQALELPSKNPVFIITNYILDSLSHDVLKVSDGKAKLGRTVLSVKGLKKNQDPTDIADLGEQIELKFHYESEHAKYPNPSWNRILDRYKDFTGETHIPFPTSSLRLAERARQWSTVATCFLVADKSFTTLSQLRELDEPELVPHGGGFSFNANLQAFGELALDLAGMVHHTGSRDGTLDLSHVVFPAPESDPQKWRFWETDFRLSNLDSFHAVDRFRTKESVDELNATCSLRLCLDLLRLAGFDPQVFYELSDDLLTGLEKEEDGICELEDELADALPRCLSLVYPLPDDVDVSFEIGRVAYRMEAYELARRAFTLSKEQYGDDPRTRFNLGLTWYYRDRWEKAKEEFEAALHLDPAYEDAELWLGKTINKLEHA